MIRALAGVFALLVVAAALDERYSALAARADKSGRAGRPISVSVVGSQFRVKFRPCRALPQEALKGTVLCLRRWLRAAAPASALNSVEPDPRDKDGESRRSIRSRSRTPKSGEWRNACLPDPDGRRLGFPLAGRFTADGRYEPLAGQAAHHLHRRRRGQVRAVRLQAVGKAPTYGASLAPYYQACVRLVRADYAGDGRGTTKNGQPIDIYDSLSIQAPGARPDLRIRGRLRRTGGGLRAPCPG